MKFFMLQWDDIQSTEGSHQFIMRERRLLISILIKYSSHYNNILVNSRKDKELIHITNKICIDTKITMVVENTG